MIIGISGKKQSGKNTVVKIINFLATGGMNTYVGKTLEECFTGFSEVYSDGFTGPKQYPFKEKLFADKLKDIVCMLIGCTREQLEDNTFKETPLGEEWIRYGYADGFIHKGKVGDVIMNYQSCDKERYELELKTNWQTAYKSETTPRLLLQLLDTDCGRKIIHPNIWVNALISEYRPIAGYQTTDSKLGMIGTGATMSMPHLDVDKRVFPNWIITDVRFPNEVKAIKDRGGIVVRVNRNMIESTDQHESEIALDNYKDFDIYFENNSDIVGLVDQIATYLTHIKII